MDLLKIVAFIILVVIVVGPILVIGLAILGLDQVFGSGNSLAPWGLFGIAGLVTFGLYKLMW